MIDKAKIAVIHVAKTRCGIDDDSYRALLKAEGGVDSSRDLDKAGFDRLMKRFEKLGFVSTAKQQRRDRRRTANRAGLITHEQQALIERNYRELGFDTFARKSGFNRRCCRKAMPQTRGDANKVIEGQKALLNRASATS